ncbi:General transcription factor II-I repeat domain-containing protein 2A [Eumeta japonica]|uniref:General transcription factor II-I repeat domain-containing protein 2A n=1 Tax=Eumeta variegata TaxID=151549 RepID=A0A4C1VX93_EUMVA|nr:General transcription factor II-I repeat domain-containing protein 2A [Eumeta japonica]
MYESLIRKDQCSSLPSTDSTTHGQCDSPTPRARARPLSSYPEHVSSQHTANYIRSSASTTTYPKNRQQKETNKCGCEGRRSSMRRYRERRLSGPAKSTRRRLMQALKYNEDKSLPRDTLTGAYVTSTETLDPALVFDPDPSHTFVSDPVPTLIFDPSLVLNFASILTFDSDSGSVFDSDICPTFNSDSAMNHSSDLTEAGSYLNDLNLKLQKQGQLVNDLYSHLKAFQNKIRLWEVNMLSGNSYHFTTRSAYEYTSYAQFADELKLLSEQFSNRFSDFKNMEDCFNLYAIPTKVMHKMLQYTCNGVDRDSRKLTPKSKFEDESCTISTKNTSKKTIFRSLED